MLFNSTIFIIFFIVIFLLYWTILKKNQNNLLLIASYGFYGFWDWRFLILIFISTIIDFTAARKIFSQKNKKAWLVSSILINFGILLIFKYFNFFIDSFNHMLTFFGMSYHFELFQIILPIGISFYTFQTVSYTIDVYNKKYKPSEKLNDFALFVSFFPQLIAGPIERASSLIPQIQKTKKMTTENLQRGTWLIFWGFFKKVFIADNLAYYNDWGIAAKQITLTHTLDTWLNAFAFYIRFYCDFSGYSDMAIGLALLLGIKLSRNFSFPHFSSSLFDFWRRWHMTLNTWFKDYVYDNLRLCFPNKVGRLISLLFTCSLIGFWHGADVKFILWGLSWGVILSIFSLFKISNRSLFSSITNGIITNGLVIFIGIIFVSHDINNVLQIYKTMLFFDGNLISNRFLKDMIGVAFFTTPLIAIELYSLSKSHNRTDNFLSLIGNKTKIILLSSLVLLLMAKGNSFGEEFIYFAF